MMARVNFHFSLLTHLICNERTTNNGMLISFKTHVTNIMKFKSLNFYSRFKTFMVPRNKFILTKNDCFLNLVLPVEKMFNASVSKKMFSFFFFKENIPLQQ